MATGNFHARAMQTYVAPSFSLTTLSHVPLEAQRVWRQKVDEVGFDVIQKSIDARNQHPLASPSWPERRAEEALNACDIGYDKHVVLPLWDDRRQMFFTFKVDFKLRIRMNGRSVLFEPHSPFILSESLVSKFELAMQTYGHIFYIVWVIDTYPSLVDRKLTEIGRKHANMAHERWYLMEEPPNDGEYHNRYVNMKSPSPEVLALMRRKLWELKRMDSGTMPLLPGIETPVTAEAPAPLA